MKFQSIETVLPLFWNCSASFCSGSILCHPSLNLVYTNHLQSTCTTDLPIYRAFLMSSASSAVPLGSTGIEHERLKNAILQFTVNLIGVILIGVLYLNYVLLRPYIR
ncbi:hypothetical protein BKA69DRAFT_540824 [Paraphysoderma sedebokerense]|nr:hypothetical protein BKA69DRAFT_540824 [Paraphysoderma sedebokerense]